MFFAGLSRFSVVRPNALGNGSKNISGSYSLSVSSVNIESHICLQRSERCNVRDFCHDIVFRALMTFRDFDMRNGQDNQIRPFK
jgi:hypothetical protein